MPVLSLWVHKDEVDKGRSHPCKPDEAGNLSLDLIERRNQIAKKGYTVTGVLDWTMYCGTVLKSKVNDRTDF